MTFLGHLLSKLFGRKSSDLDQQKLEQITVKPETVATQKIEERRRRIASRSEEADTVSPNLKIWGSDLLGGLPNNSQSMDILASDSDREIALTEENATKANIDHALQWIDEREGPDTEVFIYFSGHGGPITEQPPLDEADQTDELLGVYDTNDVPQFVDYVLDDDFNNQLTSLETQHLAVILDACNSGGMEVTNPNRAVLAASQENQNSWESSELEPDIFTYYMLKAMLDPTSNTNSDNWVSVQEIYDYAHNRVSNNESSESSDVDATRSDGDNDDETT